MENTLDYLLYGIDSSKKLLYSKWSTTIDGPKFREGLLHLLQVIHANDLTLWIHESKRLYDLTIEDQKWITEVLALLITQSSLKYLAVVRPEKSKAITSGNALREKAYRIYGKNIRLEFFDSVEDAKAWILPNLQHYKLPSLNITAKVN